MDTFEKIQKAIDSDRSESMKKGFTLQYNNEFLFETILAHYELYEW